MKNPLDAYFEAHPDETRDEWCERVGTSRMTLWRLARGEGECSTKLMRKLSAGTNGEVTELELMQAFYAAKKKASRKLARAS